MRMTHSMRFIPEDRLCKRMDASIAAHAESETLDDQPVAKNKLRVAGPFTVEAAPFPSVLPLDEAAAPQDANSADLAIARSGESARHHRWREIAENRDTRQGRANAEIHLS